MEMLKVIEGLNKEFNPKQIKQRRGGFGKTLSYLEGHSVIRRLNDTFGHNWDFELIDPPQIIENSISLRGRLTVRIVDGENETTIIKEAFGGKNVTKVKDTGAFLDLAADFKSASTDALKKAASLLGIGLDLYGVDESDDDEKHEEKVINKEEPKNLPIQENQKKAIETLARNKKIELKTILTDNKVDDLSKLTENQAKIIIENLQKAK